MCPETSTRHFAEGSIPWRPAYLVPRFLRKRPWFMDRNPGRLQRAIIELIESSGSEDVGWTTSCLCEHVYGGKSSKSQRGALMRAIKTMKLPLGWKFERGWDELQLINDERFYARRRSRHEEGDGGVSGRRR
jgi:hypothetical protein